MKKSILILILIFISIVLFSTKIIFQKDNKIQNNGNNKTIEEIEQYLINIESYKANIDVTIISNKNQNQYKIEQQVKSNYEIQKIKEPDNIANMEIIYENGTLQIRNTDYNFSKVYNDYPYVSNNNLFLTDFIKTYRETEGKSIDELEDAIYMKINKGNNQKQILRIDKKTCKPISLEIKDNNNQTKIYILYNEIELNI